MEAVKKNCFKAKEFAGKAVDKVFGTIKDHKFQALCSLYLMRAITILALVIAVFERDTFDIALCSVVVAVELLPMEKLFTELL